MRIQGLFILKTLPLIKARIRQRLLDSIKNYPHDYFSEFTSGKVTEKVMRFSEGLETLIKIGLMTFVPICSLLFFSQIILWKIQSFLGLLFFAWITIHFSITWKMLKTSLPKTQAFSESKSTVYGQIVDILFNIYTVQSFVRQDYEKKYLKSFEENEIHFEQLASRHLEKIKLALGVSGIFILIFSLITSFALWKNSFISVGDITLVVVLLLNLTGYLWYMSMEVIRCFEEYGIVKQCFDSLFINKYKTLKQPNYELKLQYPKIHIKDLKHNFEPNQMVLNISNFSVNPKEKVALVGMSGSGKTTLINLILGHYQIQSGDILIDDQSVKKLSLFSLREQISIVPQQPHLFNRSIKENIRYGNLNATDEKIFEIAKITECHDFVNQFSLGYDTLVGEKGDKLSGGQKQRIAIARALIKESPIFILDEPTSALDITSEMKLLENLFDYLKDKTVIMITHRLYITKYMDRIFQL